MRTSIAFKQQGRRLGPALSIGIALALFGGLAPELQAVTITKANNANNLNLGGSWVGGVAPGASDIALWNNTVTGANTVSLGANLTWSGLELTNPAGPVTINAGNTLTLGSSGLNLSAATQNLTFNNAVDLSAAQIWNVAASRTVQVAGNLTGTTPSSLVALQKQGAGLLILSGTASNFVMRINVGQNAAGGTLQFASGANLTSTGRLAVGIGTSGSGVVTLDSGVGTVSFGGNGGSAGNYLGVDGGTGTLNANGGTLNYTGMANGAGHLFIGANTNTSNGTLNVSGGAVTVGTRVMMGTGFTGDTLGTGGLTAGNGNGTLTISSGSLTIGTANASVTDNDKGFLYLKANSGTGTATVNLDGGTLSLVKFQIGTAGTKTINFNGGTLQARANNANFLDSVTGTTANIKSGGANIDTNGFDVTIAQALVNNGGGGLTKTGAGTLTLNNSSSNFTGNIVIQQGTILTQGTFNVTNPTTTILGSPTFANRTITVNNGGTLSFGSNNALGNAATTPTLGIIVNAGGTVTNNGAFFTTLGPVTLNGGLLTAIGGANVNFQAFAFAGPVTVNGGATTSLISATGSNSGYHLNGSSGIAFNVANGAAAIDVNFTGNLLSATALSSGNSSLSKSGLGTMVVSGTNSYTGTTTINAGTLLVNGTHTGAGAYQINSTGTLGGTGSITTANANVTLASGGTLSPGASIGTLTMALGSGTLNLSGVGLGGLVFELGSGLTSDLILLSSGNLNLGTLNFDEFSFVPTGNLALGNYTLIDYAPSATLTGGIGTAAGMFASGNYGGFIWIDGVNRNVMLTVNFTSVPEPSSGAIWTLLSALLLGGRLGWKKFRHA